ncbi:TonB-dependent receptor [Seonamhaeicola maritimus]|uniref:TonB-dependent receptor plug domain-containing protein n=1 Tax=Seonamhaeicola maritimus TaxID=2591822 RepID=A0A5C7GHF4_9FLAO|nr:hypothetical protein [Seonamhaeicola maritimus]TXG37056.1 hypothetical protein FUA22_10855 [Seonamhaeicola maritimus]
MPNTIKKFSNRKSLFSSYAIIIFYFLSSVVQLNAQKKELQSIIESYDSYTTPYREIAYCHLNKSTYLQGEPIGFKAYVLDKGLKIPSSLTKNLYCIILDSLDRVVKKKLIKIDNGVANNIFKIDSLFTTGKYTFKAFTNWMKNFNEPNAFIESFKVINYLDANIINHREVELILDAQFLPEGGHFIHGVKTNVGVIIKNTDGYSVPNLKGEVYDSDNKFITEFQVNNKGIGRFLIYPDVNKTYNVKIDYLNKVLNYKIHSVERKGIAIHINRIKDKVIIEFKTNPETLKTIIGKAYKMVIHNGKSIKIIELNFDKTELNQIVDLQNMYSGLNIITLFNEKNQPILERLFFNYEGIDFAKTTKPLIKQKGDSSYVTIPINRKFSDEDQINLSLSILPEKSKSYKRQQSLVSYAYLQVYLNSNVEYADYYFRDISRQKIYELDNLLITQGWSSYNWKNIFDYNENNSFVFEDGIVVKGNLNNNLDTKTTILIYPLKNGEGFFIDLPKSERSFIKSGFFPKENENLSLSILDKVSKPQKAGLYLQFTPSIFPSYMSSHIESVFPEQNDLFKTYEHASFNLIDLEDVQKLEEIVVKANLDNERNEQLKARVFGRVDVFDDQKRGMNLTLSNYINAYMVGFWATEQRGNLIISNRNIQSFSSQNPSPLVYLDGVLLNNYEFLTNFDMSRVDYITYDPNGFGEGLRGVAGVIKIFTSNVFSGKNKPNYFRNFEFPLTFSASKKYYVPKYSSYQDDFFIDYGVVDWIPNPQVDKNSKINFTIYNPSKLNLDIYLEGVTSSGTVFTEQIPLKVN